MATKFTRTGERLFGVEDLTEDELAEIFETYHIPAARSRARWARRALWKWRATHAALAVRMFVETGLVRNQQEGLDVLEAMRARVIAKDAGA